MTPRLCPSDRTATTVPAVSAIATRQNCSFEEAWTHRALRSSAGTPREVRPPIARRKPLDGIPQHRPRHIRGVLIEESLLRRPVTFSDFSKHPPYRFVDKIVPIVAQPARDLQRPVEPAAPDVMKSRHDGNAARSEERRV